MGPHLVLDIRDELVFEYNEYILYILYSSCMFEFYQSTDAVVSPGYTVHKVDG